MRSVHEYARFDKNLHDADSSLHELTRTCTTSLYSQDENRICVA